MGPYEGDYDYEDYNNPDSPANWDYRELNPDEGDKG